MMKKKINFINKIANHKYKNDIASATALAGELLGMKLIYLEAGSGAEQPVPAEMIKEVKEVLNIPLIVGGGIDSAEKYQEALKAGADLIVVGNALEKKPELLLEFLRTNP
jgi:putative glycerol-1-phosphate prenyltransferase